MSHDEIRRPTEAIAALASMLADEPRLRAELQRARRQFFGEHGRDLGQDAAEHRFAEWFALERESETLGAVPAHIAPYERLADDLQGSIAGLFLIRSVDADCATATDVQDGNVFELAGPGALAVGDLLVGRLYPISGERWARSAAAPALRPGDEVAAAFRHDLERLELDRRLWQIELEHLLLHRYTHPEPVLGAAAAPADPPPPLEHLEAALEQLLLQAGNRHSATALSQQLAIAERPGNMIGPLLDQLAFDTDVDLDRARELMLQIWNAHHAGRDAPPTDVGQSPMARTQPPGAASGPPGETLGERLVRTLDEGLGARRDVDEVFQQLERLAGLTPDDADDDGGASDRELVDRVWSAPPSQDTTLDDESDTGDLAPLVLEYDWETGREPQRGDPLRLWVELQRNAPLPNTDFESIPASDLMRLLLHVYLRAAPDARAAAVRRAFADLQAFCAWVAETQEIDRRELLQECRGSLLDQLDRLQEAGLRLSDDGQPEQPPGLLQVEQLDAEGFGARDDDGGHYFVRTEAAAREQLRVGDLLLGGMRDDATGTGDRRLCGLVVVLPLDARALIE